MKDKETFNFEGRLYDVSFDKRYIYLYVVIDKLSGARMSQIIPAANDLIAIAGFKDFLNQQKDKNDINVYELKYIGILDDEEVKICDGNAHIVFDSRDNIDEFIEQCTNYLLAVEE